VMVVTRIGDSARMMTPAMLPNANLVRMARPATDLQSTELRFAWRDSGCTPPATRTLRRLGLKSHFVFVRRYRLVAIA
jgi:hypothetical protein